MMQITEILRLVFVNIVENKFKMMLTSLGIIVGAATIVLVIAIGRGGKADVADQFKNLNAGAIEAAVGDGVDMDSMMQGIGGGMGGPPDGVTFSSGNQAAAISRMREAVQSGGGNGGFAGGGGGFFVAGGTRGGGNSSRGASTRLTADDVEDLKELVPALSSVTILQNGDTTVYGGDLEEEKTVTAVGAYADYQSISNLTPLYGRFIEEEDTDYEDYVCVIGYDLAEEIFSYAAYAYGDYLEIDGKNYEIVGVLEQMGAVTSGISPDTAVYLPYTTAQKHLFGNSAVPKIAAVADSVGDVPQAMEDINTILTENYPDAFFDVTDAGSAMEAASSSANTLALLLMAVASIVFIVGGIGIMNVLFVSVKERTAEIGILKAIGCSKKSILLEFLMEASIISVIGGILGVGASFALLPLVKFAGMRVEPNLWAFLLALVFAVVTGTVFGFYPAWKASRLVPIEALNLE